MKIGFDITSLIFSKSGVGRYCAHITSSMLKIAGDDMFRFYYCNYRPFAMKPTVFPVHSLAIGLWGLPSLEERTKKLPLLPAMNALWQAADQHMTMTLNRAINHRFRLIDSAGMDQKSSAYFCKAIGSVDIIHHSQEIFFRHPEAKNVITLYDIGPFLYPKYFTKMTTYIFNKMFEFARHHCDMIFVPSYFVKQQLISVTGLQQDAVCVIHAAVAEPFKPMGDTSRLTAQLARYKLTPGSYLLYTGTAEPRKNLTVLLKAFNKIAEAHPSLKLVLAGIHSQQINALPRSMGGAVKDNVICMGFVPEDMLVLIMNGARIFVYPSLYEGFGLPPLEAMACGVPVISSNAGSLPEVVGDAALQFNPYDPNELTQHIEEVLGSTQLCGELKEKGLKRAASFSWKEAGIKMLSAYRFLS
jgi:glycosyltransferase involved in cell wall biosynthesis